jgi:hypothetical protein
VVGTAVKKVKRKSWIITSFLWLMVISFLLAAAAFLFTDPITPQPATKKASEPSKEQLAAQPARKRAIEKMMSERLFASAKRCETTDVCLEVLPRFYNLTLDEKSSTAGLVWAYYSVDLNFTALTIHLIDSRTGKKVGKFDRRGLNMS